ncbi:nucleotidyl transferase AbiEii/AbiGii toxin family protein [Thomasclavelia sp.]|uniref:nucleotidyl transferase AbiEii/AbiGii toxin family protein n=1 Tax=Thomasclavelia sp. TaxID=3025757 RepID=UPI0026008914|nr:nucleotidyl transferase AbiEii/AbiGii toxin family protein [Thomasclavelia sp.]
MGYLNELIIKVKEEGYDDENAEAKVCQDIILKAISNSSLKNNVTIKGGVVMRSISHNIRRATQDIDIDFIRYSLSDQSIIKFISKLNCVVGVNISIKERIDELKHQDYHGKRVYIHIEDDSGDYIDSKLDIGVHKDLSIIQEEYCFDVCLDDSGVSLLMNSKEQMFTEKLRSLLKFGTFSRRYKDIFDLYYLSDKVNTEKLLNCFKKYIFMDSGMKENNMEDIIRRVSTTLNNRAFQSRLNTSRRNWVNVDIKQIVVKLIMLLEDVKTETAISMN